VCELGGVPGQQWRGGRSAGGGMRTTEESKGAASGFGDRRRCGGVQVQPVRAVMTFG
jgi:hypothetical protein